MSRFLISGSSGFIGSRLFRAFLSEHRSPLAIKRKGGRFCFPATLREGGVVVHVAGCAGLSGKSDGDARDALYKANVLSTLEVAEHAVRQGMQRFIFISSVKVNGEETQPGTSFSADDPPNPQSSYGMSKWEAEKRLFQVASETGLEVVVIRPPLVYGPGAKGNFANLIRLVELGIPVPLGAINNQRSMIAIDNLIDLIKVCATHPAAVNQVLLASDGYDLSTTDLLVRLGDKLAKPARLFRMSSRFLTLSSGFLGKRAQAQRLFSSLQVDISKTQNLLNWTPPISVDEGLRRCFESQDVHS